MVNVGGCSWQPDDLWYWRRADRSISPVVGPGRSKIKTLLVGRTSRNPGEGGKDYAGKDPDKILARVHVLNSSFFKILWAPENSSGGNFGRLLKVLLVRQTES